MSGTITLGGIGSGLDTEGIITGLVQASRGPVSALQSRAASTHAAVSTLSDLGTLLATLKSALAALSDQSGVKSYTASSSSSALTASAGATAAAGAWSVEVLALAKEQRTYSSAFGSASDALGQSGTLDVQVGSGQTQSISVESGDSLDAIAAKINASGLRVSASVLFDGTSYRMQVRGLDTGAANGLTISGSAATALGLDAPGATVQVAQDSITKIDGFTITRAKNQVSGAIPGVTLNLSAVTAAPVQVEVAADPQALEAKIKTFVDAYNAVVNKIHVTAGYSTTKATNPILAGDSMLRALTQRLSGAVLSSVAGAGTYATLGSVGLSLAKDGTLSLDASKLERALSNDSASVASVLAGVSGDDGAMDLLSDVVDSFAQTGTGLLATRKETLEQRAKELDKRVEREQQYLEWYQEMLRKQFSAMDGSVASSNASTDYLSKIMMQK
jgi:flagellar hook-associated protein 2